MPPEVREKAKAAEDPTLNTLGNSLACCAVGAALNFIFL